MNAVSAWANCKGVYFHLKILSAYNIGTQGINLNTSVYNSDNFCFARSLPNSAAFARYRNANSLSYPS